MATLKGAILENVQYDFEDTEARETAQSALTQAETNANDITTAETNITTAQTTADEAKTAAAAAQTTADEAKTAAATAQTTADEAKTAAATAQATAEEKQPFFGTYEDFTVTAGESKTISTDEILALFGIQNPNSSITYYLNLLVQQGTSSLTVTTTVFTRLNYSNGRLSSTMREPGTFRVSTSNNNLVIQNRDASGQVVVRICPVSISVS